MSWSRFRGGLVMTLAITAMAALPAWAEPDRAAARQAIYGGASWTDARATRFFGSGVRVQVHEVFRARYREQAQEKLILIYQLTPGPREQFRCHACQPALGGAVMAQNERGDWQVQARGELLMAGAPFSGPEDLRLMRLSADRWGLRSRHHDVAQGLESRRERVLLQVEGQLLLALDEGFTEKPGPGACGPGAAEQNTALLPLSGSDQSPRLELVLRHNEGACPTPEAQVRRLRLELQADGRFHPY